MSKLDELEAMQVAMKLVSERVRQIQEEGFDIADDNYYMQGELATAASVYAMTQDDRDFLGIENILRIWPWDEEWLKLSPGDRVKELVKAGALIIAEIQRLWRADRRLWLEEFEDVPGFEGRYQRNGYGIKSLLPWKKVGLLSPWYDKHGTPYIKLRDKSGNRKQFKFNDLLKK